MRRSGLVKLRKLLTQNRARHVPDFPTVQPTAGCAFGLLWQFSVFRRRSCYWRAGATKQAESLFSCLLVSGRDSRFVLNGELAGSGLHQSGQVLKLFYGTGAGMLPRPGAAAQICSTGGTACKNRGDWFCGQCKARNCKDRWFCCWAAVDIP